jgi:hypothetical protein
MFKQVEQNTNKTMYSLKGHFGTTRAEERASKIYKGYNVIIAKKLEQEK